MELFYILVTLVLLLKSASAYFKYDNWTYYTPTPKYDLIVAVPAHIDKTLLIKRLLQGPKVKLITAPREFCKSTSINMLHTFLAIPVDNQGNRDDQKLEETRAMFNNCDIYKKERKFFDKHMGKYPVLHLNFWFRGEVIENNTNFAYVIKFHVRETYKVHSYLINSTQLTSSELEYYNVWLSKQKTEQLFDIHDARIGLKRLLEFMYKHFGKKVYVLIDNYDDVLTRPVFGSSVDTLMHIQSVMMDILRKLTKENVHMKAAVITGISDFARTMINKEGLYEFLEDHPLVGINGFLRHEIEYLFKKFDLEPNVTEEARRWYDGYNNKNGAVLYNPIPILQFVQRSRVECYWKTIGEAERLEEMYHYIPFRRLIKKLIRGACIPYDLEIRHFDLNDIIKLKGFVDLEELNFNTTTNYLHIYMKYLFQQGYLSYGKNSLCIKLANEDAKYEFIEELKEHYIRKYRMDDLEMEDCFYFLIDVYHRAKNNITLLDNMNSLYRGLQVILISFKKEKGRYVSNDVEWENIMFALTGHAFGYDDRCRLYGKYKDKNGKIRRPRIEVFLRRDHLAVALRSKHFGDKEPDSKVVLKQLWKEKNDEVFGYTKGKVTEFFFLSVAVNNNASISISCLLQEGNRTQVLTVPNPVSHFK